MQDRAPLRIGCVEYLNARPLIRGWPGPVEFNSPAVLCRQLAAGALDVALVSSFELLRNPIYRVVAGISISSDGPAYSVVVAYQGELQDIRQIELDPASETSVALLRCLLAKKQLDIELVPRSASPAAQLLIGDRAIRFRQSHNEFKFWDLGAEWKQIVDLPFVYALWLARPDVADAKSVADRLRELKDENLNSIDGIIEAETEFDREFCARYYREHLQFTFGAKEKQGLQAFARECAAFGLIPKRGLDLNLV